MRLLSLNIAAFEANNEAVSKLLVEQKPDILCLQEVVKKVDNAVKPEYVSKDTIDSVVKELKYSHFARNWTFRDFHKKDFHKKESFDFEFGGFVKAGNYIKSRFKIIKKFNIFIKNWPGVILEWTHFPDNQAKAIQIVDIILPNSRKLRIINYHGIWTREKIGNKETLEACQKILKLAKEVKYPTIIVGDFNLFPDTVSMKVFYKDFTSLIDSYNVVTTRPGSNELSHLKRNVVDYILVSKGVKVNSFAVLDRDVSDHFPLTMDFAVMR